jgi:hypothetical protein
MVHVPIAVSDKFKGKSKQGLFGDVMMEIDWSVGEVMKALKANGVERIPWSFSPVIMGLGSHLVTTRGPPERFVKARVLHGMEE